MPQGSMQTLLGTILFTLLVPCTVAGLAPYLLSTAGSQLFRVSLPGQEIAGGLVAAAGVAIYLWCAWNFTFVGRGTPSPTHPPRALVVRGLYHFSRNPMYVGVVSVLIGEALATGSGNQLAYTVACAAGFHIRVVLGEEATLRRTFGAAYDEYCARVPRWIGIASSKGSRHED